MKKKKIISMAIIAILSLFSGSTVFAANTGNVTATVTAQNVAVTLSQSSFDYGTVPLGSASSTVNLWAGAGIIATNTGNVPVDVKINGADATGGTGWTLDTATSTQDHFAHTFCNKTDKTCTVPAGQGNYIAMTASLSTIKTAVAAAGTVAFQLQIETPQTVSDYVQKSTSVTVTVVAS